MKPATLFARIGAGFDAVSIGLGITMTIGYGVLFYSFAMLAPEIMKSFGWSRSFVFGAFSLALLSGAVLAPVAGRALDRFGGRAVLCFGSILAGGALVLVSQAQTQWGFLAALVVVEAASAFVLYEIGFATLTQIHGRAARPAISAVTLIAGFASTIFWPLCGWLLTWMSWRDVYLVLAAIYWLIALPIHFFLPRHQRTPIETHSAKSAPSRPKPGMWAISWMAIAFAANGFVIAAVQVHFPSLFVEAGYSIATAAAFGTLIGPFQVAARILDLLYGQTRHPVLVGIVANAALCIGVAFLFAISIGAPAAIAFAIFFGTGQGLAHIIRGSIPLALFGPVGYGRLTGNLGFVRIVFTALAPFAIAWISDVAGSSIAIATITIIAAISLLALLPLLAHRHEDSEESDAPKP